MKIIKYLLVFFVLTCLLSSCAIFTGKQTAKECANAPYVYSNLQDGNGPRNYHLPDGTKCPVNNRDIL